jgi:hypothetical protein
LGISLAESEGVSAEVRGEELDEEAAGCAVGGRERAMSIDLAVGLKPG